MRMDPPQSAEYMGIKPRTLKRYRQERKIPFYALGHSLIVFDRRDLDAFMAARRVEAL